MAEEKLLKNKNLILARLLKPDFWFQVGAAVALWIGVVIVGRNAATTIAVNRVGHIAPYLYRLLSSDSGKTILVWGTLTATFLSPLFVAMLSVVQTSSYIQSQEYTLLCLSRVSKRELLVGQIFAMLFRLRLYLSLVCGLLPALGILGQFIVFQAWFWYSPSSSFRPCLMISPLSSPLAVCSQYMMLPAWLPSDILVWAVCIANTHLLAIILGVELSCWLKKSSEAMVGTFSILVIVMLAAVLLSYLGAKFYPLENDLRDALMITVPLAVGVMVGWLRLRGVGQVIPLIGVCIHCARVID